MKILFLLSIITLSSCINPNQPNGGFFSLDVEQAEANRQYTHRIEGYKTTPRTKHRKPVESTPTQNKSSLLSY
jgi:hypothetical protein